MWRVNSQHAQYESNAHLFHVKDKKSPRCIQRSPINWTSFKSNYVMILKTPKYIFIWIGRCSSQTERLNAFKLANKMRMQCKQMPEITTIDDGYEQSMHESKKKVWNEYLCLSQRVVHPSNPISHVAKPTIRLYKCGFNSGKYRIEEIKSSMPLQHDMNDNRAYIVDCGSHFGVWIWVGRHVDIKDKSEAMRNARGFVKKVKKRVRFSPLWLIHILLLLTEIISIDNTCDSCGWWLWTLRVHSSVPVMARHRSIRKETNKSFGKIRCVVTYSTTLFGFRITIDWWWARRFNYLSCQWWQRRHRWNTKT